MSAFESLRVALRALQLHPLRSTLTLLGVVIGVAALVAMVAIGGGASARVAEQIRTLGTNLLLVQPGSAIEGAARLGAGTRRSLSEDDAAALAAEVRGVLVAAPTVSGGAQLVYRNRNWSTLIGGVVPDYLIARDWSLARGRAFTLAELERAEKVALLGATTVTQLFADEDPLGQTVRIASVPFTVVGVLAEKGQSAGSTRDQDDVALIPLSAAKLRVLGAGLTIRRDAVDFILVKVEDSAAMAAVAARMREVLRRRHQLPAGAEDDFQLSDPAAALQAEAEATRSLAFLLAGVAGVALVVGGIGIMNVMLVAVTERTREIGVRLAVGARPRDIRRQFLIEALALSACGGLAGVLLGVGAAILIARLLGWAILISTATLLLAFAFAAATGIAFGTYPAHRASRLDPVEALRFE